MVKMSPALCLCFNDKAESIACQERPSQSALLRYRQQTGNLPPIQRCAAGGGFTLKVSVDSGRLRRPGVSVPTDGGSRRLAAETRGGQDTLRVSYPPLDTPTSSLGRDSLRSRV